MKAVLERIAKQIADASPAKIVAIASFLANLFEGSSNVREFQLARGYIPSVAGIPSTIVSQQLLDVHVEPAATRAVHITLKVKPGSNLSPVTLDKELRVWTFLDTSKQNERKRWIEDRVNGAHDGLLKCLPSSKGPPITVS